MLYIVRQINSKKEQLNWLAYEIIIGIVFFFLPYPCM